MPKHVIKYEYREGEKINPAEAWCGRKVKSYDWIFQDAQHVALSVGGSIQPCKSCIKAIIKELNKEIVN